MLGPVGAVAEPARVARQAAGARRAWRR